MTRLAKKPIPVPSGVEVKIEGQNITIKGRLGLLTAKVHSVIDVLKENDQIKVTVQDADVKSRWGRVSLRDEKALWGTWHRLIKNMIEGVEKGFEKKLELVGVGFRATIQGNKLILNIGFSHLVEYQIPEGIKVSLDKNIISLFGIDKQLVGETAARIRRLRPPEPYKGTGIKYLDEIIRKKAGKKAAVTTGGAPAA